LSCQPSSTGASSLGEVYSVGPLALAAAAIIVACNAGAPLSRGFWLGMTT
jgi:hypothetical protein